MANLLDSGKRGDLEAKMANARSALACLFQLYQCVGRLAGDALACVARKDELMACVTPDYLVPQPVELFTETTHKTLSAHQS